MQRTFVVYITFTGLTYSLYSQRRRVKSAVAPAMCSSVVPRSSHSTFSAHERLGSMVPIFRSYVGSTVSTMYGSKRRPEQRAM